MYGLAHNKGVPFNDIEGKIWTASDYKYYIVSQNIDGFPFAAYCAKILADAKKGSVKSLQADIKTKNLGEIFMKHDLIHHSSDNNLENIPQNGRKRSTYPCKKGK